MGGSFSLVRMTFLVLPLLAFVSPHAQAAQLIQVTEANVEILERPERNSPVAEVAERSSIYTASDETKNDYFKVYLKSKKRSYAFGFLKNDPEKTVLADSQRTIERSVVRAKMKLLQRDHQFRFGIGFGGYLASPSGFQTAVGATPGIVPSGTFGVEFGWQFQPSLYLLGEWNYLDGQKSDKVKQVTYGYTVSFIFAHLEAGLFQSKLFKLTGAVGFGVAGVTGRTTTPNSVTTLNTDPSIGFGGNFRLALNTYISPRWSVGVRGSYFLASDATTNLPDGTPVALNLSGFAGQLFLNYDLEGNPFRKKEPSRVQ